MVPIPRLTKCCARIGSMTTNRPHESQIENAAKRYLDEYKREQYVNLADDVFLGLNFDCLIEERDILLSGILILLATPQLLL